MSDESEKYVIEGLREQLAYKERELSRTRELLAVVQAKLQETYATGPGSADHLWYLIDRRDELIDSIYCTRGSDSNPQTQDEALNYLSERRLVALNDYQRANLLWLFRLMGYPNSTDRCEPFHFACSGDWVAEIAQLVGSADAPIDIEPCISTDQLRRSVARWAAPWSVTGDYR